VSFFKTLRVEDEAKKIGTYAIRSPAISKNPELMRVEYGERAIKVNFQPVQNGVNGAPFQMTHYRRSPSRHDHHSVESLGIL
jgi:hypothetical protein